MKKKLLSFFISLGNYQDFVNRIIHEAREKVSCYVCVANVHMLVEAHRDPAFASVVNNATIVTPDGKPLTWALRFLYGIKQVRVAGMDLLPDLLNASAENKIPIGFYGGTEDMLKAARDYINIHYSNLEIAFMFSPPFRKLETSEESAITQMINESGAQLIFVVLGCPKQEKWMYSMVGKIQATMIGIGGALPVLVGLQKRAPRWMQHSGLEWLYRMGQEPRRLFKRYAVTNILFIYLLLKEKLFS